MGGVIIMVCEYCKNNTGLDVEFENVTVSVYGGKYNFKRNDNTFVYEERLDPEDYSVFSNGAKILICPSCYLLEEA
tara:strand:+ start:457 stop:684 length:228 start_codon:yes stop_codon:yes gene_type:complete